ncbi:hypothetical protein P43SY_005878 [Pythium insidiosum]|uniref:Importin N-terminal domain-containing protein n=1 Tax=Pythium insidiosum TaxID=114742 RepID=A0AAD5LTQ6_PYTIN|nr:hypothetical protein P43SY_005878 [Pythium insidiosum]
MAQRPKSGAGCAGVACEHSLAREPLHLYGYLWSKPDVADDTCGTFSFVLPDTVLFKHQKPVRWFFTSKQERGKKFNMVCVAPDSSATTAELWIDCVQGQKSASGYTIIELLSRRSPPGQVVAIPATSESLVDAVLQELDVNDLPKRATSRIDRELTADERQVLFQSLEGGILPEGALMADYAPEQLEALLLQLTNPDTQQIKQAEELIKVYLKKINSVAGLLTQLQHSTNPAVRQYAALLLRRKMLKHWPKLDAATQGAIKQTLLARSVEDPIHVVRTNVAALVSALATREIRTNNWPELLVFINQSAASPAENQREISMLLLQLLAESIGTFLQPFVNDLKPLYSKALQDPESLKVRIASMRAACALVEFLEDQDLRSFQELVPLMIQVLQQCIVNGAETEAVELMDALSELAVHPFPILDPALAAFVDMLLQITSHETLETGTRASAMYALGEFIKRKPKAIGKKELVPKIFSTMLNLIAMDDRAMCGLISNILERDSSDHDAEAEDESPGHLAQQTLDTLALSVPGKYLNSVVFAICSEYMSSADPTRRKAGVLTLGILSEGCHEVMCQNIKDLLPPTYAAAQDQDQRVRGAACFALGQFAEFLQPAIADHYSQILPLAIALLDDPTKEIKASALYVVDEITQSMESHEAAPYIDTLVKKLVDVLRTSTPQLQKMCLDALGSIAVGAKEAFLPYLAPIAELIQPFSNINDPQFFFLRGAAMECLGYLAVALGKEAFRPYYAPSMEFVLSSFVFDDSELKEQSFVFFINISSVYKEEFAQYLEHAATLILQTLNNDDDVKLLFDDDLPEGLQGDDEDDEDDEEDDGLYRQISIRTDALNAKVRAIAAIEEMAIHCGQVFEQYIPKFLEALAPLTGYIHEDVRAAVAEALAGLVICSFEAAHPGSDDKQVWVKGDFNTNILPQRTQVIVDAVVRGIAEDLLLDSEEVVVEKACNALKMMSARVGPVATMNYIQPIAEVVHKVLKHEHECQIGVEQDEEDGAEGGSVLEAAAELVGVLGKCYGEHFLQTFDALFPALLAFTAGVRADRDSAAVIGCFAEVLRETGAGALNYVERVLPAVIQGLTSENYVLRANSAFCLGILAEISGAKLADAYQQMLQALYPLFAEGTDDVVADNAAAAVARMITANPAGVPLEAVLPVFLSALPLKADADEVETVFRCLNGLVQSRNAAIMNVMPQVVEVYAKAFSEHSIVEEEEQAKIKVVLRGLWAEFEAQMNGVVAQLSPELQASLQKALQ